MTHFTLNKKFLKKSCGDCYLYNEEWVTNGHFMIKKYMIKDVYKYLNPEQENVPNFSRIMPEFSNNSTGYEKSNWLYQRETCLMREFKNKCGLGSVWIDEDYCKHFNINFVESYSNEPKTNPLVAYDKNLILMPLKCPEDVK